MKTIINLLNRLFKVFNLCLVVYDKNKARKMALLKMLKSIKEKISSTSFYVRTISGGKIILRTDYNLDDFAFSPGTFVFSGSDMGGYIRIALCVGVGGYKEEKERIWFLNEDKKCGVRGWSGNNGVYSTEEYRKLFSIVPDTTILSFEKKEQ